ncbi:MAG TPA: CBS domain-containing protein [Chthoniobacterales bacterium]|nr:CBS domain-containing protein [Chthoniobacterales bacterium]
MKVKDVMTKDVRICGINDNLASAARTMWVNDCGILPIVNNEGITVGVVTDRDICMATGSKDRRPSGIAIAEVMMRQLYSCPPEADIREALQIMREKRVRRLPVLDENKRLCGILSLDDVAVKTRTADKPAELSAEDVEITLDAICRRASQLEAA